MPLRPHTLAIAAALLAGCQDDAVSGYTLDVCVRPEGLEFGDVPLRDDRTRLLSVQSCGTRALETVRLEIVEAPGSDAFTLVQTDIALPVKVGDFVSVPVRFRPTALGPYEAEILVYVEEDAVEPHARVAAAGVGVAPPSCDVVATPATLDFGAFGVGGSAEADLTLTNQGSGPCRLGGARITAGHGSFLLVDGPAATLSAADAGSDADATTARLRFAPTTTGPQSGAFAVVVDGVAELSVPLAGEGTPVEACVLVADPSPLVAPRAVVGEAGTTATTTVTAVGTLSCTLTGVVVSSGGADFTLSAAPGSVVLDPSETAQVVVAFAPTAAGSRSGTLQISTAEGTVLEVPLGGFADPVPTCFLEVTPSPLVFPTTAVGLAAPGTLALTNDSERDCVIADLAISAGAVSDFTIDSDLPAAPIAPGQTFYVDVTFTPSHAAPAIGDLEIDLADATPQSAALLGFGAFADVRLTPALHHFGVVTEGCASPTKTYTLSNIGTVAARLDAIALSPLSDPNFELVASLAAGTLLMPGTARTVSARLLGGDVYTSHYGELEVQLTGTAVPTRRGELYGRSQSVADSNYTDVFTQQLRPIVDFLFVIDNSGSMGEEQDNLALNFDNFMGFTSTLDIDYRIGVTTTDDTAALQGLFTAPFITNSGPSPTADPEAAFGAAVAVGTNGSGTERGLIAAVRALSPPLSTDASKPNYGFLRHEALLSVVFVSDEEDQSNGSVASYLEQLIELKNNRQNFVLASAIAGDPPSGCSGAGGSAAAGARYRSIADATGGVFGSICASDWASLMEDIGLGTYIALTQFPLSAAPDPATLVILVDGVVVPMDPTNGWSYDPASQAILFNGESLPEAGAEVEISYSTACIAP